MTSRHPPVTVEVVGLTAAREPAYASFVAAHPLALISYTLAYRDMLAELLDCEPRYAVALRDGAVVGVMPLMSLDGERGTVLNSLPYFGSNGGPLVADREAGEALGDWYAGEVAAEGVLAGTVIANPLAQPDVEIEADLDDVRVGHVTPLGGDGDAHARISAAIDGSARRNVAKAQRCGICVTIDNDDFDALEDLHRRSMEAIGAQVKTPAFFAAVARHFRAGTDFDLYVAHVDAQPLAALLVFYGATTVDYYVPAASPDHRSEQPMAPILLQAMTDAARRGYANWNWGGSWPAHESLQRFKAKWGGVRREYRYATTLNDRDVLHARPEELRAAYPGFFVVPFSSLIAA